MPTSERDSVIREFATLVADFPPEDFAVICAIVNQERFKRDGGPKVYQDVEHLAADKDTTRRILDAWIRALEKEVNEGGAEVGYMDAFMAVVNLARAVLEDIERRQGIDDLGKKRVFRQLWLSTAERSLMKRLEN